jgi:hypothetical protein
MFNTEKKFARKHIILTSTNHFAGGFGLALLLQHYLVGGAFLPVVIGWILVAYMAVVHMLEFTSK